MRTPCCPPPRCRTGSPTTRPSGLSTTCPLSSTRSPSIPRRSTAITRVRSMPTFENTMMRLEESGRLLGDVARTFYTVSSADATAEIQAIEEELAPLMSAHEDVDPVSTRSCTGGSRPCTISSSSSNSTPRALPGPAALPRDVPRRRGTRRRAEGAAHRDQSAAVDADDDFREEPARGHERPGHRLRRLYELDGLTEESCRLPRTRGDRPRSGRKVRGHPDAVHRASVSRDAHRSRQPSTDHGGVPRARHRAATRTTTARC